MGLRNTIIVSCSAAKSLIILLMWPAVNYCKNYRKTNFTVKILAASIQDIYRKFYGKTR